MSVAMLTGAVVALKPLATAKSRFGDLDDGLRRSLVWAMAHDTLHALESAVDHTVLVTAEPAAPQLVRDSGLRVEVVAEPSTLVGLDAAFVTGIRRLEQRGCQLVACVMADLPTLTPTTVRVVLDAAARAGKPVFVRDADDVGTAVLAGVPSEVVPRFGGASAQRHRAYGAIDLVALGADSTVVATIDLGPARHDVDDVDALRRACCVGVGPQTRQILVYAAIPAGDRPGSLLSC